MSRPTTGELKLPAILNRTGALAVHEAKVKAQKAPLSEHERKQQELRRALLHDALLPRFAEDVFAVEIHDGRVDEAFIETTEELETWPPIRRTSSLAPMSREQSQA
jgi:hypothetical protein